MAGIARISSGAPWEPIFGYTRAVRAGDWLAVSGTTSFDESGRIAGRNQMYVQARQAIANIAAALERAGMTLENVVRTRIFITDMKRFPEVARAHMEFFGAHPPASTVVEVRRLVHPDMMIEIEADAFLSPAADALEEFQDIEELEDFENPEDALELEAIIVTEGPPEPAPRPRKAKAAAPAKSRAAIKSKAVPKPKGAAKAKLKPVATSKAAPKKAAPKKPAKPARKRR